MLLLGLLLFECIINAGLFAKGMSTGLMGGILVAAVAAIINIAASWYVFAQLMGGLKIRCNSKTTHFKIGLRPYYGLSLKWHSALVLLIIAKL